MFLYDFYFFKKDLMKSRISSYEIASETKFNSQFWSLDVFFFGACELFSQKMIFSEFNFHLGPQKIRCITTLSLPRLRWKTKTFLSTHFPEKHKKIINIADTLCKCK